MCNAGNKVGWFRPFLALLPHVQNFLMSPALNGFAYAFVMCVTVVQRDPMNLDMSEDEQIELAFSTGRFDITKDVDEEFIFTKTTYVAKNRPMTSDEISAAVTWSAEDIAGFRYFEVLLTSSTPM